MRKYCKASTSEVYGDPIVHPQPEFYWGNVNRWGTGHVMMKENDVLKHCLWITIVRIRHVSRLFVSLILYGPRMLPNDGRVVSNFIIQALNNEDITIYGDGKQTRSFQYIDDLIEGMVRMMDTEDDLQVL